MFTSIFKIMCRVVSRRYLLEKEDVEKIKELNLKIDTVYVILL